MQASGRFRTREVDTAEPQRGTNRANWAELLEWKLDKALDVPIYEQVAGFLRRNIVTGLIPAGSRLPSSRQLVQRLGVSRTTVMTAYSQLLADGYIVGQIGSGTYVSHDAIEGVRAAVTQPPEPVVCSEIPGLSAKGDRYRAVPLGKLVMENVPFNTGIVRVDARTAAQWHQLAARHLSIETAQLGYADPMGEFELRSEIAKYLAVARGVRCRPEQIMIVSGTQQAIDLTIKVLLDPGAAVWVEDPGYPLTGHALTVAGMRLQPVPVDQEGLCVVEGVAAAPSAKAVFVTPSHQYPLGVSLSLARRAALLKWAAKANAWIIEDDYDAEFRYSGTPLPALQALDQTGRVIYIGSFSKVLFPGLRYAYAVIPERLIGAFAAARFLSDRHSPAFYGKLIAEFMSRGHFISHVQRMRNEYRRARDLMVDQLTRHLGHLLEVCHPNQGMHLIAYLRDDVSDVRVAEEAQRAGIVVRPISRLYRREVQRSGLMLGFTGFDEHRMRSAIAQLGAVLEHSASGLDMKNGSSVYPRVGLLQGAR